MKSLNDQVNELFKGIIKKCRSERRLHKTATLRALSRPLGITENFLSSIENGREFPSFRTFLSYLVLNGFDTAPLMSLTIQKSKQVAKAKARLVAEIYSNRMDDELAAITLQQYKTLKSYRVAKKKLKKRRRVK